MMVFSIYDSKAEAYDQPFFARTVAEATRFIAGVVANTDHQFHKFAEDYALFEIGHWNPQEGILSGSVPRSIVGCWVLKAALKGNGEVHRG